MENDNLKNRIKKIREVKMTSAEKAHMLQSIFNSPISTPYTFHSFVSIFSKKSFVYAGSLLCLVVIAGSGTVFASGKSLPGNILYSLKVKVVEPVRGAFITSPIAKVEYQNNLATKRLVEAETLASKGNLDAIKEEELNSLLEEHTNAFDRAVTNLGQNENIDKDKNDDIVTSFQATMNAHARILNIVRDSKNDTGESTDTKISKTAKEKAKAVRDNFKNKEEKKNKDKNLDQNQKQDEDTNDAHEKQLDSDSSLKEAEIFLKAELRLELKN